MNCRRWRLATGNTAVTDHPSPIISHASLALARCDELARWSEEAGRLTRRFATPALAAARATVAGWMHAAGMEVRRDNVGNLIGRYTGARPAAGTLLLGSHLDSVRDAGRYDGPLGILAALACVERLHAAGRRLPFAVEVAAFADEEGVRFGTAYLGSAALAGRFDPAWLDLRDEGGVTLAEAIRADGGDPAAIPADRHPGGLLGYCEAHIEQGPVLEARGLPLGIVSAIAGQGRYALSFRGEAGHAGTVPMALRRDALCAAAEFVLAAEHLARERPGLVATVGQIAAEPGASNVIPGRATLSLDVRHHDDSAREAATGDLRAAAARIAAARGVALDWQVAQEHPATPCDPALTARLARAIEAAGYPVLALPSGAGHDAVMLAPIAPVAMLFIRCAGGISHNPAESVAAEDVAAAIEAMERFLLLMTDDGGR